MQVQMQMRMNQMQMQVQMQLSQGNQMQVQVQMPHLQMQVHLSTSLLAITFQYCVHSYKTLVLLFLPAGNFQRMQWSYPLKYHILLKS